MNSVLGGAASQGNGTPDGGGRGGQNGNCGVVVGHGGKHCGPVQRHVVVVLPFWASAPAADHHSHTAAATSKIAGRRDGILEWIAGRRFLGIFFRWWGG